MIVLVVVTGMMVLVPVAGLAYHAVATRRERRRHPPPGELVAIDGTRLHLVSAGRGSPTVVLDSALAGTSLTWSEIQPKLAELTRVVSYDRAGFGWSEASRSPRTVENMVRELDQLLARAEVETPYVLVGHSYGGWIAELYAARHRDKVAGLVLVDTPHPSEWMSPNAERERRVARGARLARRAALAARFGAMRLMFLLEHVRLFGEHERVTDLLSKTPTAIRAPLRTFWVQSSTLRALASQIDNAPRSAATVFEAATDLGDLPLVVLTAANPGASRLAHQRQTTSRSRAGRHVVATSSGHWIPLEESELIVDAVREIVESVR